jgi:ubiquitin-protein ligase
MNCIYCKTPIEFQQTSTKTCLSNKCIAQLAFDTTTELKIHEPNIVEFIKELAKSASTVPKRFDPLPDGFQNHLINTTRFTNYLQASLPGVKIIEDVYRSSCNAYSLEYQTDLHNQDNFTYLFHGSPFHNWHSILRNGLKNYSGTDKMTTGAAWGNGVYLSDNLQVSYTYTGARYNNKYIVGVFEVRLPEDVKEDDVRAYYRKTSGIYVVPDEKNVRLKYIVVMPNANELNEVGEKLIQHYMDRLKLLNSTKSKLSLLAVKRLTKEKSNINKLIPNLLIEEFIASSGLCWKCVLINEANEINFNIYFPIDYPCKPPSVRVDGSHPNIIDGNVCMDVLYNWKITNCLDMIVLTLINEIFNSQDFILRKVNIKTVKPSLIWNEINRSLNIVKYF